MDQIKELIKLNLDRYPDFNYYQLHISKIEENLIINPDIAIETCKSFIEGISKSILNRLDKTFDEKVETSGRNSKSVQQLFKLALEKIAEYNDAFEYAFIHSSGQIINITSQVRTARGDISHGRSAPKESNSNSEFSIMISKMTDIMMTYVLSHFFKIDLNYKEGLKYDSEDMEVYNTWLDDSTEFPIKKAKYSKLLFENDYDEYETRYYDEFIKPGELDQIAPHTSFDRVGDTNQEDSKELIEGNVDELLKIPFNEAIFWDDYKNKKLNDFSTKENLDLLALRKILNEYLFSDLVPLGFKIIESMKSQPTLINRRKTIEDLTHKIIEFAKELKA